MPTSLITTAAIPLLAAASGNETEVPITEIALGDGGGAAYDPHASQTDLVNERMRIPIASRRFLAPQRWRVMAEVPATVPNFQMREMGFFAADGTMVGVWAGADVQARDIGVTIYRIFYNLNLSAAPAGSVVVESDDDDLYRHALTDLAGTSVLALQAVEQAFWRHGAAAPMAAVSPPVEPVPDAPAPEPVVQQIAAPVRVEYPPNVVATLATIHDLTTYGAPERHGQFVMVQSYHAGTDYGGGTFVWDSERSKSDHDGVTVFSATVPWTADLANYHSGEGETDPDGAGCWVRQFAQLTVTMAGARKMAFPPTAANAGTATYDSTAACQQALNVATELDIACHIDPGIFYTGTLILPFDCRGLIGAGSELTRLYGQPGKDLIEFSPRPGENFTSVGGCRLQGMFLYLEVSVDCRDTLGVDRATVFGRRMGNVAIHYPRDHITNTARLEDTWQDLQSRPYTQDGSPDKNGFWYGFTDHVPFGLRMQDCHLHGHYHNLSYGMVMPRRVMACDGATLTVQGLATVTKLEPQPQGAGYFQVQSANGVEVGDRCAVLFDETLFPDVDVPPRTALTIATLVDNGDGTHDLTLIDDAGQPVMFVEDITTLRGDSDAWLILDDKNNLEQSPDSVTVENVRFTGVRGSVCEIVNGSQWKWSGCSFFYGEWAMRVSSGGFGGPTGFRNARDWLVTGCYAEGPTGKELVEGRETWHLHCLGLQIDCLFSGCDTAFVNLKGAKFRVDGAIMTDRLRIDGLDMDIRFQSYSNVIPDFVRGEGISITATYNGNPGNTETENLRDFSPTNLADTYAGVSDLTAGFETHFRVTSNRFLLAHGTQTYTIADDDTAHTGKVLKVAGDNHRLTFRGVAPNQVFAVGRSLPADRIAVRARVRTPDGAAVRFCVASVSPAQYGPEIATLAGEWIDLEGTVDLSAYEAGLSPSLGIERVTAGGLDLDWFVMAPPTRSVVTKTLLTDRVVLDTGVEILSGIGSPEGVIGAPVGSTWHRHDGSAGAAFYVKEAGGAGNAGWAAK